MRSLYGIMFSFSLLLTVSCKSSMNAGNSAISSVKNDIPADAIVYLFFTIEKMNNGSELVKHSETQVSPGTLKKGSLENHEKSAGNILITFLDASGNSVSERIIEDPLNPLMEIYTEEGLNREKMNLPKAEFSVRFSKDPAIASVKLEKITQNSTIPLLTLNLQ